MSIKLNCHKNIDYTLVVVEAQNLPAVDNHATTSDPYVVVKFGDSYICQTAYIKKNLNPVWNHYFRHQSERPIRTLHFTVRDHNTIKHDVTLGEATLDLDQIDLNTRIWEGSLTLSGHQIKPPSASFLTVRLEVKNFSTLKDKVSNACNKFQDTAKQMMIDKSSNLARLAFLSAHSQMVSRNLEGSVEIEVKMGWFIVFIGAEIEQAVTETCGKVDIVEDSDRNTSLLQTKPTKGMKKTIESRVSDVLDQIQVTTAKVQRDIAVTVKAGVEIGFIINLVPKLEIEVKVLLGVKLKATIAHTVTVAQPIHGVTEYKGDKEDEMKDLIYKIASGTAAL